MGVLVGQLTVQFIAAPSGEYPAVLPEREYEALLARAEDAADHAAVAELRAWLATALGVTLDDLAG